MQQFHTIIMIKDYFVVKTDDKLLQTKLRKCDNIYRNKIRFFRIFSIILKTQFLPRAKPRKISQKKTNPE